MENRERSLKHQRMYLGFNLLQFSIMFLLALFNILFCTTYINLFSTISVDLTALSIFITFGFFVDSVRRMNGFLQRIPILRKSERMFNALSAVYGLTVLYFLLLIILQIIVGDPAKFFANLKKSTLVKYSLYVGIIL